MSEPLTTRSVLDVVHGLLAAPPAGGVRPDAFLTTLARAFGVSGAGLTRSLGGPAGIEQRVGKSEPLPSSSVYPWLQPRELPETLRTGAAAIEGIGGRGEGYLLAAAPGPEGHCRVLWLEEPPGRIWTDAEKASLLLAGSVLGRYLPIPADDLRLAHLNQGQVQQRLQDAAVMSGRVAHAFDNILTGIVGFSELTLTQTTDAILQQYLGEVLQAAQAGIQLTQQLHLFNRCAVRGSGPTRLALVVADEEIRLGQSLDPQVEFKVELTQDLPPVGLDAEPLRQVISQLTDNARESLTGPGRITLSARKVVVDLASCADLYGNPSPGPAIEITVSDTGCGLSPEARQRLFREPFFTTKPRHRGLGLAVVYRILQVHQGGFQLEAGPQGGTHARVYLPQASESTPPTSRRLANVSS